jgi:hypothetical protein
MMLTIWKYPILFSELNREDRVIIEMPQPAEILSVGFQDKELFLWALVDDTQPKTRHMITVHGTGTQCNDVAFAKHLGTVQVNLGFGALVWHVFHMGEVK